MMWPIEWRLTLMKVHFTLLRKTVLYYAKLSLIRKILLHEKFFDKNWIHQISFYHSKIYNLFIFILIYVLEYQLNTKGRLYVIPQLFYWRMKSPATNTFYVVKFGALDSKESTYIDLFRQ